MKRLAFVIIGFCLFPSAGFAETLVIVNARVHTMAPGQPVLENGTILVKDGVIESVGQELNLPDDARRIDAQGRNVTPGLISAATQLGLTEHSATATTSKCRELLSVQVLMCNTL
jgi:imidazolonepropionase-like amidohydrolase